MWKFGFIAIVIMSLVLFQNISSKKKNASDVAEEKSSIPSFLDEPFDSQNWIKRKSDREECLKVINSSEFNMTFSGQGGIASQFYQDWILYDAIFRFNQKSLFYVDLAAATPKMLSNTWFFDQCKRWEGICIEANSLQWDALSTKRNCEVIKHCISTQSKVMKFMQSDFANGYLNGLAGVTKFDTV